jgi:hypothetical protein
VKKKREAKKQKVQRKQPSKTVTLTMDRDMKGRLERIAIDALTDIPTAAQVLLATCMHMGSNVQDHALKDTVARVMELEAKLCRCREVMEANDPISARDIFGEPAQAASAPEAPAAEEPATVT